MVSGWSNADFRVRAPGTCSRASKMAAPMADVTWTAVVRACCALKTSVAAAVGVGYLAGPAQCAAQGGVAASSGDRLSGIAAATMAWWIAVPRLPSTTIPSAPPSSAPVCANAETAPRALRPRRAHNCARRKGRRFRGAERPGCPADRDRGWAREFRIDFQPGARDELALPEGQGETRTLPGSQPG